MHRTYIADVERGARNVSLKSIVSLAKALELTAGRLLAHAVDPAGIGLHHGIRRDRGDVGNILLIEDSETDAALAVRAFRMARVINPVKVVSDAENALDYLSGSGRYAGMGPRLPQLILLDLNLPRMSGLDFLRSIKRTPPTRGIPVVVLTVSRNDRMIVECRRLGAEHYIVKPVGIESVFRVTPKLNLCLTLGPLNAASSADLARNAK
jgi:CheY-like chemotaxis protein